MLSDYFSFCRIADRTVEEDSYVPPAKHLASPPLTGSRKRREKYRHIFDERVGKKTVSFWKVGASLKLSLSLGRAQSRSHACMLLAFPLSCPVRPEVSYFNCSPKEFIEMP